jgi:hypothetical protein
MMRDQLAARGDARQRLGRFAGIGREQKLHGVDAGRSECGGVVVQRYLFDTEHRAGACPGRRARRPSVVPDVAPRRGATPTTRAHASAQRRVAPATCSPAGGCLPRCATPGASRSPASLAQRLGQRASLVTLCLRLRRESSCRRASTASSRSGSASNRSAAAGSCSAGLFELHAAAFDQLGRGGERRYHPPPALVEVARSSGRSPDTVARLSGVEHRLAVATHLLQTLAMPEQLTARVAARFLPPSCTPRSSESSLY